MDITFQRFGKSIKQEKERGKEKSPGGKAREEIVILSLFKQKSKGLLWAVSYVP
jgi:hypothetical protein